MKKTTLAIACMLLALLVAVGGVAYTIWKGQTLELPEPEGFVAASEDLAGGGYEEVVEDWLAALFEPYTHFYTPGSSRVKEYAVTDIELREELESGFLAQVHLTFKAKQGAGFEAWPALAYGDGWYVADWVILLEPVAQEGQTRSWRGSQIMRPAAYDLAEYNTGGQRELDEYAQQYEAEGPWTPAQYPYKIEGGRVYVSYDAGESWVETPLPLDSLDHYVDGHQKTNALQEGSYQIGPEKTVLMYGGGQTPLTCLWSDDGGATWQTAEVEGAPGWIERKFVAFPDAQHGFLAVGWDKTMSWEACDIYATSDGGATWQYVRNGPGSHPISAFVFFDENEGYISYSNAHRGAVDVCRTVNGGVDWNTVELPVPEELEPWFTNAGVPYKEGETLVLLVGEDAMSDRSQKQDHYLRFVSEDGGASWVFEDEIQIEAPEPG